MSACDIDRTVNHSNLNNANLSSDAQYSHYSNQKGNDKNITSKSGSFHANDKNNNSNDLKSFVRTENHSKGGIQNHSNKLSCQSPPPQTKPIIEYNQQQNHQKDQKNSSKRKFSDSNPSDSSTSSSDLSVKHLEHNKQQITSNMLSNPIENHYSRDQELRYTNLSESNIPKSLSSYSIDSAHRIGMPEYDVPTVHSTSHRPYDPGSIANAQTAFERYDPNYPPQRPNMYATYGQPSLEDLNNQQKYLMEQQAHHQQQQVQQHSMMKLEQDDNAGPVYPRPMYHYDPTGTTFRSAFPVKNLSVQITSAQLPYKVSSSSPSPTSTTATTTAATNGGQPPSSVAPIIDLSTSNITSTSPNGFNASQYTNGQRLARSPQPGASPLASPQVPSPQGQTLDLSVSRLSHRYTKIFLTLCSPKYFMCSGVSTFSLGSSGGWHEISDNKSAGAKSRVLVLLIVGWAGNGKDISPLSFYANMVYALYLVKCFNGIQKWKKVIKKNVPQRNARTT